MNNQTPGFENLHCADTRSQNSRQLNSKPAFLDKNTGRVEIAKLKNGVEAPMHIISWLPEEWAICFDENGLVLKLKSGIVPGFEQDGCFYARDEVAEL